MAVSGFTNTRKAGAPLCPWQYSCKELEGLTFKPDGTIAFKGHSLKKGRESSPPVGNSTYPYRIFPLLDSADDAPIEDFSIGYDACWNQFLLLHNDPKKPNEGTFAAAIIKGPANIENKGAQRQANKPPSTDLIEACSPYFTSRPGTHRPNTLVTILKNDSHALLKTQLKMYNDEFVLVYDHAPYKQTFNLYKGSEVLREVPQEDLIAIKRDPSNSKKYTINNETIYVSYDQKTKKFSASSEMVKVSMSRHTHFKCHTAL